MQKKTVFFLNLLKGIKMTFKMFKQQFKEGKKQKIVDSEQHFEASV